MMQMMSPGGVAVALAFICLHTLGAGSVRGNLEPTAQTHNTCKLHCELKRHYIDISFFLVGDHPLKNYLYVCETQGITALDKVAQCVLDVRDITKDTPQDFVATAAVIVKCLFPAELVIVNPSGVKMRTISLLELRHCAVAWSAIATFGKAVGLRGLTLFQPLYVTNDLNLNDSKAAVIPTNHIFPPIPGFNRAKQTLPMISGLHTLGKLEIQNPKPCGANGTYLHCFEPGKGVLKIVNLPSIISENIWPEMAELVLHDMNLTSKDIASLPRTMPFLQSMNILRNTGSFESFPQFPWCKKNMFLPHSMSRTEYGTYEYTQGAEIPPNLYRRFFTLEFLTPQQALPVKFEGVLDKLALRNTVVDFGNEPPNPFESAYGLQILLLQNNRISRLPDHALQGHPGFIHINLTNNNIMDIGSKVFRGKTRLRKLAIAKNRISRLAKDAFSDLISLEELDLSYNRLTDIKSGTFTTLKKLKKLCLNDNLIDSIEQGALPDTRANLLIQLDLQNNRLKTLTSYIILFPFASKIDLSKNGITSRDFMSLLKGLQRDVTNDVMSRSTNQSDHRAVLFRLPGSRVILSLADNFIDNIDIKDLNSPESKSLEWLLSYFTIDLTNNPLNCDCAVYPWYKFIKKHRKDDEYGSYSWLSFGEQKWRCTKPPHLKGRPLEHIKEDEFECQFTGSNCPEPCECHDRLNNDVTLVKCHGKNLTTLPEEMPEGLLELHFEDNQITQIPPRTYLYNVTELYLARNQIENITDDVVKLLSVNVNRIQLQDNKIERITKNVTKFLSNVTEFNLLKNALVCNCSSKWLQDWLRRADYLVRADDMKCIVGGTMKELSTLTPDDFDCPVRGPEVKVVAGIAAGVILLLLLIGVFFPAILKGRKKKEDAYKLRTVL
ncbi:protein toll-like [Lineus longissimus]|uniref:protein toll-like n=1 Tax=Lineus longissimus TaxID=88925 RepID=UPI00315D8E70